MAEAEKPSGDVEGGSERSSPVKRADKGTQKSDGEDFDESNTNDLADEVSSLASVSSGSKGDTSRGGGNDRRKFRTITFGRRYKTKGKDPSKKRKGPWNFRLNCCRLRKSLDTDIPEPTVTCHSCVCTGYRRTEEHHLGAGVVFESGTPPSERRDSDQPSERGPDYTRFMPQSSEAKSSLPPPMIDLTRFNAKDYPTEDWDERARVERAREIEEGIEPPPGYQPSSPLSSLLRSSDFQLAHLASAFQHRLSLSSIGHRPMLEFGPSRMSISSELDYERSPLEDMYGQRTVHTQIDYIHCLVPDLLEITNCSFYWGKMDRYEAEKLLENRPEGTFLLRDSAQEEYLFSVSFRRYGRSLHARIEQWNHKFSFDSHDPGVFASDTVCGLIEHYKDPSCCMFFEPMLTIPLHRTFAFPLQHLCRAVVSRCASYDGVNQLHLPKCLKSYLKEYHYKQRVRVRRFESEQ